MATSTPSAVILDRDGTINRERGDYVRSWVDFEFLPGVLQALALIAEAQLPVVVVTNQSAVGRGLVARETLNLIHEQMVREIEANGGDIEAVLVCPHTPVVMCACRKPEPGNVISALGLVGASPQASILIGNAASDVEAARRARVVPVLLAPCDRIQICDDVIVAPTLLSVARELFVARATRPHPGPAEVLRASALGRSIMT